MEALRGNPVFAGLGEKQLEAIWGVVRSRRIPRDTVILREGDAGDSLYILAGGSVEVTKRLGLVVSMPAESLKERFLMRLEAPQFFGEMGLLDHTERSATVTAREECEVLEITKADFERLTTVDAALGYLIVRNIATVVGTRLRRADRDIVKLTIALSLALGNR